MFLKWVGLILMHEGSGLLNISQFLIFLVKVPLKRSFKNITISHVF